MKNDTTSNSYETAKSISEVLNSAIRHCSNMVNKTNSTNSDLDMHLDMHLQAVISANENSGERGAGKIIVGTDETGLDAVSFGLSMFTEFLADGKEPEEVYKLLKKEGYNDKVIKRLAVRMRVVSSMLSLMTSLNDPTAGASVSMDELKATIKDL
jgi:hypothetical protein